MNIWLGWNKERESISHHSIIAKAHKQLVDTNSGRLKQEGSILLQWLADYIYSYKYSIRNVYSQSSLFEW